MKELDLLDEKDDRVYLVYMTNRQDAFVLFERDFGQMMARAFKEINMGYTNLWAMKRIGLIQQEKVCYFPDNELLIEPQSYDGIPKTEVYIIFLFIRRSFASPFIFSRCLHSEKYKTFESASEAATRLLKLMKDTYPDREFKAMCAKLLYNFAWH